MFCVSDNFRVQSSLSTVCFYTDIGDASSVDATGYIQANGSELFDDVRCSIKIDGSANVSVKADSAEAALYTKVIADDINFVIGDTAMVIARNTGSGPAANKAPSTDLQITSSTAASGDPVAVYDPADINGYKYLKIEQNPDVQSIDDKVAELGANVPAAVVDALADQIMNLPENGREALKPETIDKVDQLLQEATGVEIVTNITTEQTGLSNNKTIQDADINGILIGCGIRSYKTERPRIELRVTQVQPGRKEVLAFECQLFIDGKEVKKFAVPVKVTVELPPEFYPVHGDRIHHTGDGIDEWLNFIYDGADNTTQIRTGSFSRFSIVRTTSSGGGSGSGGSGGSGGGGGGGSSHSRTGAALPGREAGRWILDNVGWWYQYENKSYPKDGWAKIAYAGKDEWYFFDKNGYMVTGWVFWNGSWYYMCTAPDGTNGKMLTGWQTIDGKLYYFSEAIDGTIGIKRTNIQIGEYFLDQDGVARKR